MSLKLGLTLIFALAFLGYLFFWPVPIDPAVYIPSHNPGMTGPFAQNANLSGVEHLVAGLGLGPEDVTLGPDGLLYTGLQDGRIMRFRTDGSGLETFVSTEGRPLGMQFDEGGNLIVADAFKGLLSIGTDREVTVLTDEVDGRRILFADDLDIAGDGTVWFSDASQRFDQHHWILDFWEMQPTGRLLSYDPATRETAVRLDGLMFANGVALGPNDEFVLVNETSAARITRLWLKGPKAGQDEPFLKSLPAYNDNLSYNHNGVFWVALPSPRNDDMEGLWPQPFLRTVLFRLPEFLQGGLVGAPYGWVLGVDTRGSIVFNLHDPSGDYGTITSVNEFDGWLYFGSIAMSSVGRHPVP